MIKITKDYAETNPFTVDVKLGKANIKRIQVNSFDVIDKATGLPLDHETIIIKEIDKRAFIKFFDFEFLTKLSKSGILVLHHILTNIEYERDCIVLDYKDYDLGSKSSFYNGINNLIDSQVIAKSTTIHILYWINPSIFFKGNYLNLKPLTITK